MGFDLGYTDDDTVSQQVPLGFQDSGGGDRGSEASQEDAGQQSSAGLPADASRGAGQSSRAVAGGTSLKDASLLSKKRPSDDSALEGEQVTKKGKAKASSSRRPAESSLQAKHKESSNRVEQVRRFPSRQGLEANLRNWRSEKKGDTGPSSSIVTGASSKAVGLTSHELGSVNSRTVIASLQPSLMPKGGKAQGVMKVSEWSFPLSPPTTKDLPVKPFTEVFPDVPFPGSHQDNAAGASKARKSDGSRRGDEPGDAAEGRKSALKLLRFTRTLSNIPENSVAAPEVGSQAM
ncbi:hypothetical protein C8J56DRAFT_1059243 [Mycena floridula]|nr:hypothetical protein C8J56DRAFT_1059243 [Mycena floridula]